MIYFAFSHITDLSQTADRCTGQRQTLSQLSFLLFTTHFQGKKSRSITFEHSKSIFLKAYISENGLHVPRQQFLPNRIRMIQIKKLEINIGYRPLLSMHK